MFAFRKLQFLLLGYFVANARGTNVIDNANHIFNAIHSSMRQWGSSLNHNGMSFFLATVPEGTQFYHGTSTSQPVNGTEWLAFEPEHAMGFARPHRKGPPGYGKPPDQDTIQLKRGEGGDVLQEPLKSAFEDRPSDAGYLHTYATRKDLRLLYIDGMSAGKTSKGTLDSQDRILLNDSLASGNEFERAHMACQITDDAWDGRIDGFIRMEAGFEIILCHFERDLEVVWITQTKPVEPVDQPGYPPGKGPGDGRRGGGNGRDGNIWVKAVSSRYHSIGGHRVSLNYEHFVTAYTHELDLFATDSGLPRLAHIRTEQLDPLRHDLHDLVMMYDPPSLSQFSSFDWQAVADMIVTRYSDELQNLVRFNFTTAAALHQRLERLLGMFIDYSDPKNSTDIIYRCSNQFIPRKSPRDGVSYRVIYAISESICSHLTTALLTDDLEASITNFRELISYLSWTTWKDCRGCPYNQLCFIPMWPMGSVEDYEHPHCQNFDGHSMPWRQNDSYWGPPMHHPPESQPPNLYPLHMEP